MFSSLFLRPDNKKTPLPNTQQQGSLGILATLFNVGCNSHKSTHDPTILLETFRGGLLPRQKNLSQRRGLVPFVISTSWFPCGLALAPCGAGCRGGHRARTLTPLFMVIWKIYKSVKHKISHSSITKSNLPLPLSRPKAQFDANTNVQDYLAKELMIIIRK